jgi:hypothetical protein
MPVWFVSRSPYDGPTSKHVQRLEGPDTLLGWFRSVWRGIPDIKQAVQYADSLLGTQVYSFGSVFRDAAEQGLAPPATDAELHARLQGSLYVLEFHAEADAIQVLSDDDELCMAMYWFTDAFAAAHPERVAWLLHDDWRLPDKGGPGQFVPIAEVHEETVSGQGEGALYVWNWCWESASDLEDGSVFDRLAGMRLPDVVPWLLRIPVEEADSSNVALIFLLREPLRDVLLASEGLEGAFRRSLLEEPTEPATWAPYTDWLAEQDLPCAELRLLELAVLLREGQDALLDRGAHHLFVSTPERGDDRYAQLIFFDDVWASGNVVLAQSLIAYALRWNVLSDWSASE